jgi:hypothetical protein
MKLGRLNHIGVATISMRERLPSFDQNITMTL